MRRLYGAQMTGLGMSATQVVCSRHSAVGEPKFKDHESQCTELISETGFPRLAGLPVAGRTVAWSQVHIFRVANGQIMEHWAVRDDLALLEQIQNTAP
jgi:SnoaL-like polyketide cyclase